MRRLVCAPMRASGLEIEGGIHVCHATYQAALARPARRWPGGRLPSQERRWLLARQSGRQPDVSRALSGRSPVMSTRGLVCSFATLIAVAWLMLGTSRSTLSATVDRAAMIQPARERSDSILWMEMRTV